MFPALLVTSINLGRGKTAEKSASKKIDVSRAWRRAWSPRSDREGALVSRRNGRRVRTFIARIRRPDLDTLGVLVSPCVSRTYPLDETAAALAEIESGHVRGKLAIVIYR